MIKLANVSKSFNDLKVLDNVTLNINDGEIFGMVGLSGAGKSTLLRCINLLERPDSGSVIVDGKDVTKLSSGNLLQYRLKVGMIFQGFNLFKRRSVRENVAFPLEIAGSMSKPEISQRVEELLELVGLREKADSYPRQLSGGQQQRVAIARALANNPQVLLCDEPTSALDPLTSESILKLLADINEKLGLTIVLITHQMQVIRAICHRVAVVHQGKIAELGPVEQVIADPKSVIARDLLRQDLPQGLEAQGCWRLTFAGDCATEPVVARLMRDSQLDVNILAGNLEQGRSRAWGWLLVRCSGEPPQQQQAISMLEDAGVKVEVLDYAG